MVDELAEKPIGGPSVVNVLKLNVNLIKITDNILTFVFGSIFKNIMVNG
jgi:hypothetical protein